MNIFVSTKVTQGQRPNDFSYTDEGEMLAFGVLTCTNETADAPCGCARSMVGLRTRKATTTMKVMNWNGSHADLAEAIAKSLQEGKWYTPQSEWLVQNEKSPRFMAYRIATEAAKYRVGTIVEYRNGAFSLTLPRLKHGGFFLHPGGLLAPIAERQERPSCPEAFHALAGASVVVCPTILSAFCTIFTAAL